MSRREMICLSLLIVCLSIKSDGRATIRTPCQIYCSCNETKCRPSGEKYTCRDVENTRTSPNAVTIKNGTDLPMNSSRLMQEVELYLSLRPLLIFLHLENISLYRVPSALCRMTDLVMVNFINVSLAELPQNCFSKIEKLRFLPL